MQMRQICVPKIHHLYALEFRVQHSLTKRVKIMLVKPPTLVSMSSGEFHHPVKIPIHMQTT
jgi:hypothetical protein